MSRGVTAWVPRVMEHTGWSLDRTPIRRAVLATWSGPTSTTSWAKIVFTELARASLSAMVPADSSAKLLTSHGLYFSSRQRGSSMVTWGGPDITASGS